MKQFDPVNTTKNLATKWLRKRPAYSAYPSQARNVSTWVIGQPGMGKSKFIESQVIQDIMQGRSVGLIDIHGDLFQCIIQRVAAMTIKYPHLAKRVVIVDPTMPEHSATINPLEALQGQSQARTALFLTDIIIKIWAINPNESPRLVWLLTNSFLALANLGLSLADFPRWLQDRDWRDTQVPLITHDAVQCYWANEFPHGQKEIQQWIAPATNKLGGLLFDDEVRHVLTGQSQITMRELMDRGLILLVHIPKGILGEKSAHLLGAFIVAQIQKAALSRADSPNRRPFYLYLDEFQNYTTDYIQDVLAESRKYALSLVLAHQFMDQLSTSMRSAVLNTSGTIISFRVGYKDARAIVYELFPYPDFPIYAGDIEKGSWERLALELANLQPRDFWVRRRGPFVPSKKHTLDMLDLQATQQLDEAIRRLFEVSGKLYGSTQLHLSAPSVSRVRPEHQALALLDQESTSRYSDVIWDE